MNRNSSAWARVSPSRTSSNRPVSHGGFWAESATRSSTIATFPGAKAIGCRSSPTNGGAVTQGPEQVLVVMQVDSLRAALPSHQVLLPALDQGHRLEQIPQGAAAGAVVDVPRPALAVHDLQDRRRRRRSAIERPRRRQRPQACHRPFVRALQRSKKRRLLFDSILRRHNGVLYSKTWPSLWPN